MRGEFDYYDQQHARGQQSMNTSMNTIARAVMAAAALAFCSGSTVAAEQPDVFVYPAELVRVVDGDTMDFRWELFPGITKQARVRVADFDAAETWRPSSRAELEHGQQATQRAKELLQPPLHIRAYGWGVFNRVRADIILPDGSDFAQTMISEGFQKRDNYESDND